MKLSLGFSPCPNDTFIFDAMLHGKVDTEGLAFEVLMADVEELNRRAFAGELAVTKLSFHAFAHLTHRYVLLDAGSALGHRCGPLLIARTPLDAAAVEAAHIAIPGQYTTANFLLGIAWPKATRRTPFLFSDIEQAVLDGRVDAGLIIHENRFTYQEKGLVKIMDLGEYWEDSTGHPIPLGGIVARRDLDPDTLARLNRVMARSVAFALANPLSAQTFVAAHAQEMDEAVMAAHINLYVNGYTADLGTQGRAAVRHLLEVAAAKGLTPTPAEEVFL